MTIYNNKTVAKSLEIVSGHNRFQAMLAVNGKATVEDSTTGEQFEVQIVADRLQLMKDDALENLVREGRKWNAGSALSPKKKAVPFYRQFSKSKY